MAIILALIAFCSWLLPLCDWHHSHCGGSSPDPETEAIVAVVLATVAVLLASTLLLGCVGGPLVLLWTRKVRHLFWAIPVVNALVYLIALYVRPFPGGFAAQFRMPGLAYTIIELIRRGVLTQFGSLSCYPARTFLNALLTLRRKRIVTTERDEDIFSCRPIGERGRAGEGRGASATELPPTRKKIRRQEIRIRGGAKSRRRAMRSSFAPHLLISLHSHLLFSSPPAFNPARRFPSRRLRARNASFRTWGS